MRRSMKKLGMVMLSFLILFGMSSPSMAETSGQFDRVNFNGKVAPDLLPKGAQMDELVEIMIEFQGDPVLKKFIEAKNQGKKLGAKDQKSHAKKLSNAKNHAKQVIKQNGGEVIDSLEKAFNGLYAQVERSSVLELAQLEGVTQIHSVKPVELHNDTSVPFIGAPEVWEKVVDGVNVTGEGVSIAIIDTGIDYTHASFGGEGTPEAYESNNPDVVEEGTFPTAKVVGGYDFVGTNYDASSEDPDLRVPKPDADPLDEHGHGTHVGATSAGYEVEGKIGAGVAPDAKLYAYKVFGESGSTAVTAQAIEMAVDPNGDGDVSDHVDVINMSLGSPYGHPDDPSAQAANLAVEAGVTVVASAGNSGNAPFITGSPAVAEKAISVAASVDDGIVVGGITVNSPDGIAGQYEAVEGAITTPLSETGAITNDVVYVGQGCMADEYLADPSGKIALIDRGTCAFTEKLKKALDAGAVAGIVANNSAGDPIVMGGDPVSLPGVMVSQATGNRMKEALSNGEVVNVTLSPDIRIPKPELADTIADFSSKGPGRSNIGFKPEISAPGYSIDSAAVGTGDGSTLMSGTSMAAPHVAGVAALLTQLHPDWTPEEIKSLIMNTSTPIEDLSGEVYPLSRQGAGRVQVDVAAETTSVVSPQAISLGYMPLSGLEDVRKNETVTVTNKSDEAKTYSVSWENRHGNQSGPVSLDVPSEISVKAGKFAKLRVDFNIDASEMSDSRGFHEFDGYIVLEDQNGEVLRIPYQSVIEKVSEVDANAVKDEIRLKNKGELASETELFGLGDVDGQEESIDDYYDLGAVGVRSFEGGVTEFVVTSQKPWETPELVEFDVYIDSDEDGVEDYILFNIDLGVYSGTDPTGDQVSVLYDLASGSVTPLYYIDMGGSYNEYYMGLPVPTSMIAGEDGQFQYQVASWSTLDFEVPDLNDGGWMPHNANQPDIQFEANSISVEAGGQANVGVSVNADTANALMINNSAYTKNPYTILKFNNVK